MHSFLAGYSEGLHTGDMDNLKDTLRLIANKYHRLRGHGFTEEQSLMLLLGEAFAAGQKHKRRKS